MAVFNIDLLILVPTILSFLLLLSTALISLFENEKTAFYRSLILSLIIPSILLSIFILPISIQNIAISTIYFIIFFELIYLFFPKRTKINKFKSNQQIKQFDERDVMFKRSHLKEGSIKFKEYYAKNPEKLDLDNSWRKKPGLMSEGSTFFNVFDFAVAKANFNACEQLIDFSNINETYTTPTKINSIDISNYIKYFAKAIGAFDCGITEINQFHYYSHSGKQDNYGQKITPHHKFGIAIIVEMDSAHIKTAPKSPVTVETSNQYFHIGGIAVRIADFIRHLGYEANAHIDGNYDLICPTVARDAGLGELGRMGILINQKLGPRHRIAIISTNMPLIANKRKVDYSVLDFCNICKKCADTCPSSAIPFEEMQIDNGLNRWKINHEKCFSYWCQVGTDCGKCISVCPYAHKNNLFHNSIRFFINHFPNFRPFALFMDDILYGRNQKSKKLKKK